MRLAHTARAIRDTSSREALVEAVGIRAIQQAERAGALVWDGSTPCLTEVGYALSRALFPAEVNDALALRHMLAREYR